MYIGHKKIVQFFENAIKSDCLGHAYCLVGQSSLGKKTLASQIAARLLGTTDQRLASHPDFVLIERAINEKTDKLHKDITVEQARQLRERLGHRSWLGGHTVIVIDEAELMNISASNALLKILEEPPARSVFFLITSDEKELLPTILSRCQKIFFSPVEVDEIERDLRAQGAGDEVASIAAKLSWGCPGKAIEFWRDDEKRSQYFRELSRLSAIVGAPFHVKLSQIDDLFGKKDDDTQLKRGRWQEVLRLWQMVWRDALLRQVGAGIPHSGETDLAKFTARPADQILSILSKLSATEKLMSENINPRLLIEEAILNF